MNENVEKKKRGRKPKAEKEKLEKANNVVLEPLILHLNVNVTNKNPKNDIFESKFCKYDPEVLTPNAYNDVDQFISQPYEFNHQNILKEENTNNNIKDLMHNIDYNDTKPTDIVCHWCCHLFDSNILGIPIKFKDTHFDVIGCFCSFECMCAYNFFSGENSNTIWETYNLINLMAKKMLINQHIYPAPSRKCLKLFGGYMSIDEFRNFNTSNKIINIHNYPLVASVEQIEEINDYHHKNNDSIFLNFDKERLERFEKKIQQQSKDLIHENFVNTIDSSMSIT
jgi:hypothetical protein